MEPGLGQAADGRAGWKNASHAVLCPYPCKNLVPKVLQAGPGVGLWAKVLGPAVHFSTLCPARWPRVQGRAELGRICTGLPACEYESPRTQHAREADENKN